MPRRKKNVSAFIPSPTDADAIANRSYLAALLDRHHVGVKLSKKGKPLHVLIRMGESHKGTKRTFEFIMEHFGVKGSMRQRDWSKTAGFRKRKEYGFATEWKPTWYLSVAEPKDVLKLCEAALPFSERKKRLQRVIDACRYLLKE